MSNLTWLNDVSLEFLFPLVVSEEDNLTPDINLTYVEFRGNPAECHLMPQTVRRRLQNHGILTFDLPALRRMCHCQTGYKLDNDICRRESFWLEDPRWLALFALACVFLGALILFVLHRCIRHYGSVRRNLELHRRLLDEHKEEIVQLKRAWEISEDEIQLTQRIDGDAPGNFGEVWKAKWRLVPVAVKRFRMAMALMELNMTTGGDFEREVEFLRTCRHTNVLLFFGAGTTADGMPFMVLELATRGSLQPFLYNTTTGAKKRVAWELKLRFSNHIALGMAHIHSLGQAHRDLKAANCLISEDDRGRLVAKVADFGCIKQLLMRSDGYKLGSSTRLGGSGLGSRGGSREGSMEEQDVAGTPLYMSPETLANQPYRLSSDVSAGAGGRGALVGRS